MRLSSRTLACLKLVSFLWNDEEVLIGLIQVMQWLEEESPLHSCCFRALFHHSRFHCQQIITLTAITISIRRTFSYC
jgi:hypothetical protein